VDARLACRRLIPRWRDRETTESNFMAFAMDLMPQIDARTKEQLDLDADESSSEAQPDPTSPVVELAICAHTQAWAEMACVQMAKNAPTNSDASTAVYLGGRTNTTMCKSKHTRRGKLHGAVVRVQTHTRASPKTAPAWQNARQRSLTWEINSMFEPPAGPHSLSSFSKSMMPTSMN
jgi:hypothetical protein